MGQKGPFDLVCQMAEILDELGVPYALGGSMASSLLGEPRSTVDVDLAVQLDERSGEALLERVDALFYVPQDDAREAIRTHTAFNLLDTASALKVDLFVVGEGLLDRRQIERDDGRPARAPERLDSGGSGRRPDRAAPRSRDRARARCEIAPDHPHRRVRQ